MNYPKKRNLDGVYFRVERDGKFENVCFTDLSPEEVEQVGKDKPAEWWKGLALALSDAIRDIGYVCDVERSDR